jgi:3-phosphoshikimate 1-carboxyvinyltransferase
MRFTLRSKTKTLKGKIELPGSKSISNRVLIIRALAKTYFDIEGLSEADDTAIMQSALERNDMITDVGPAGTAMRFLTAYYASQPGEKVLTGSDRMKQRPIGTLVNALRALGASITYLDKEGYPPIQIEGRRLQSGCVSVEGSISSQFITALMLIGPTLPQGIEIDIKGDPLSRPYISMTKSLMESCGAQVTFEGQSIFVKPGRYRSKTFRIEKDWSASAFWMSLAVLSRKTNFTLLGLTESSIQGDQSAIDLFQLFGIECTFNSEGLNVSKTTLKQKANEWNFRDHPDLVQPAAIAAAGLGIDFTFHGLDNLRLKESDRIEDLQIELAKMGIETIVDGHSLTVKAGKAASECDIFDAHGDHRLVMSLAALSMNYPELVIRDPMVVAKSYPNFWKEFEKFVDVRPGR